MAWIESHQSLARHRKTLRAAARLSVDRATLIGHLHFLWWWGLDNVGADGRLGDMTAYEIAAAAEWPGDPEQFLAALIEAGFIDETPDGLVLHDWYDYAGKLLDRRAADRERKRRARRSPEFRGNSAGIPAEGRADSIRTQPNQTIPNQTIPNQTVTNQTVEKHHSPQPPSPEPRDVDAPEPEPPADGRPTQEWVEWLVRLYAYYAPVTGRSGIAANVRRNKEMSAAIRAGAKPETLAQVIREYAAAGMPPWEVREEACRRDGIGKPTQPKRASPDVLDYQTWRKLFLDAAPGTYTEDELKRVYQEEVAQRGVS